MERKPPPPKKPGLGRRSGIGIDQTMPEYEGSGEEEAPPPRAAPKPQPQNVFKKALSGFLTPPPDLPPAPPPKVADLGPRLERDPYGDGLGLLYDDAAPIPPAPKPEPAEAAEPPPPRSQTSRLAPVDLDQGDNALSGENSGIKWRSDRARWWS